MAPRIAPKVAVIPTPVVSEEVLAASEEEVVHPWFVDHDKPLIVAAARLERHKGFSLLTRALARVRERVDARLVILGQGSLRDEIQRECEVLGVADHVDLLGFKHNPFPYMRRADTFVLASEFEGLPNVLVQAMAFGVPIVSTDCPSGPAEILCDGKYGELVPVGDVNALAAALARSLLKPRQLEAAEHARKTYGAPQAASEYLALAGIW
jgi:glycosyltransferase involved in cell wall biosynthesis